MDAQAFQRLHPRTYLERFLAEGIRPDGREPGSWRNVSINAGSISTAEGSSLARVGDTTVVCGVKAEITEPELSTPNDGFIVPNLDLSAICSPRFKPGPPGEEAQACSQRLATLLSSSKMLSLSSLCIEPGKCCWVLYIDATCINYDGNIFDATLLAVVSALLNTRLPKATYFPETQRTTVSRSMHSPLAIDRPRIPYSFTFGAFTSSAHGTPSVVLTDPSAFEEPLVQSDISITLFADGNICSVLQAGGAGREDAVFRCIDAAAAHLPVLQQVLGQTQASLA